MNREEEGVARHGVQAHPRVGSLKCRTISTILTERARCDWVLGFFIWRDFQEYVHTISRAFPNLLAQRTHLHDARFH